MLKVGPVLHTFSWGVKDQWACGNLSTRFSVPFLIFFLSSSPIFLLSFIFFFCCFWRTERDKDGNSYFKPWFLQSLFQRCRASTITTPYLLSPCSLWLPLQDPDSLPNPDSTVPSEVISLSNMPRSLFLWISCR